MSVFTKISEPRKRIPRKFRKHRADHDEKTHGNRAGKRRKVREAINEVISWTNSRGEEVSLVVYPKAKLTSPMKRSRHTNLGRLQFQVGKRRRRAKIRKQLNARK